jgi:ubiquinone/menaquinone biosynthesis C-methylase UbiE
VRQVAVVRSTDDALAACKLSAYVVPNDQYLRDALTGTEEEHKRIQKWRKTFDLSQMGKPTEGGDPTFNIAGWNSSYTRQPIPAEQMKEWVEVTVEELRSLRPRQILEIGCGSGLLLLRLAHTCERYVGADISTVVLKKLKKEMEEIGEDWSNVTLLERSAENFTDFSAESFDTVVLNSVVKYFPSVSYLQEVLNGALRIVKPGGWIFVGDVRNIALLEPYATSIEVYQADPATPISELRERMARRVRFEEQLLLSPAFFLALQGRHPQIASVHVHPRRGRFDNEMTRFRFNAVIHVSPEPHLARELQFLDWAEQKFTLESVARLLRKSPESLAIKNIPNARIEKDVRAVAKLASAGNLASVQELKNVLDHEDRVGIDPQELWSLGEQLGYRVDTSWAASFPDGSYHVAFTGTDDSNREFYKTIAWPEAHHKGNDPNEYANAPGRAVIEAKLISELLEYCRRNLPENLIPANLQLVNTLSV